MKIIKKAEVSGWTYKFTCKDCETELEAEGKDISHSKYDGDQRDPRDSAYETFTVYCPVCNKPTTIPAEKIPKLLQIEARKASAGSRSSFYDR